MQTISDDKLDEIRNDLEGTSTSLTQIIDQYELDIEEDSLEDRLLDGSGALERSKCCEWWFRSTDLEFDEARNGGVCEQCDPEAFA